MSWSTPWRLQQYDDSDRRVDQTQENFWSYFYEPSFPPGFHLCGLNAIHTVGALKEIGLGGPHHTPCNPGKDKFPRCFRVGPVGVCFMMLGIWLEFQPTAASQSNILLECNNPKKTNNSKCSNVLSMRDRVCHSEYIRILLAASNRKSMKQ